MLQEKTLGDDLGKPGTNAYDMKTKRLQPRLGQSRSKWQHAIKPREHGKRDVQPQIQGNNARCKLC